MNLCMIQMDDSTLLICEVLNGKDPICLTLGMTAVIRQWGTTRGRGELANNGPTDKTKCDHEPPGGQVNWLHVRRIIQVSEKGKEAWLKYLKSQK